MTKKEKAEYKSSTNYGHQVRPARPAEGPLTFGAPRALEGITVSRPQSPFVGKDPVFLLPPELMRYIQR